MKIFACYRDVASVTLASEACSSINRFRHGTGRFAPGGTPILNKLTSLALLALLGLTTVLIVIALAVHAGAAEGALAESQGPVQDLTTFTGHSPAGQWVFGGAMEPFGFAKVAVAGNAGFTHTAISGANGVSFGHYHNVLLSPCVGPIELSKKGRITVTDSSNNSSLLAARHAGRHRRACHRHPAMRPLRVHLPWEGRLPFAGGRQCPQQDAKRMAVRLARAGHGERRDRRLASLWRGMGR